MQLLSGENSQSAFTRFKLPRMKAAESERSKINRVRKTFSLFIERQRERKREKNPAVKIDEGHARTRERVRRLERADVTNIISSPLLPLRFWNCLVLAFSYLSLFWRWRLAAFDENNSVCS